MSWRDDSGATSGGNSDRSKAKAFVIALKAFPQERKYRGINPDIWRLFKSFIIQHCSEYLLTPNYSLKLTKACIITNKCDYILLQPVHVYIIS